VRNFWVRRWFRTLPNYWLILTVNFILYQALKLDLFELQDLKGYVFLQNLRHPNILNAFPEGWSLSVEEWFYLTLPVAMYVLSRFKVASKEAFLFKVFTGYLLVFVIIRFINAFNPLNGLDPDEGIRKVVLFRLDAVMYGVLFAYFNYFKPLALEKIKKHLFVLCIIGFNIIFYLSIHLKLIFFIQSDLTIRFIRNAFMYLVIPLFLSLCLPYANSVKTISNKTISKIVQHISKISYSVYLIHLSLIYRPFFKSLKFNSFSSAFMYYVLYWIIIFVLSSLIYKYFEYPVMKLRDRFSTKKAVKTS